MFIFSFYLTYSINNPENVILEKDPDVFMDAKIIKIQRSDSITKLTLQYQATVPAVYFEENNLKPGSVIKIKAKPEKYKGRKQLVIEKILT